MRDFHESVLLREALETLKIEKGKSYIDATLGGGGHSKQIVEFGGKLLALDLDPEAVTYSAGGFGLTPKKKEGRLIAVGENVVLVEENFANLRSVAKRFGFEKVSGVLFDLGVSSRQLAVPERGFSFQSEAPLDMRMSPRLKVTAADLVNGLTERELNELFSKYGEESDSRRISRAIARTRLEKKIETTKELADLIEEIVGRRGKLHPATKVFQALRMAVNDEINNLKEGLAQSVGLLEIGGRLVVISFHSLEDKLVKNYLSEEPQLKVLTKKPILPGELEIERNPRSRSAKMRIAEKL